MPADPRHRRGKRHPFASVLLIACPAVLAGARSFAAIGQWARNAPQDTLVRLGARTTTVSGARIAPSTATVRRVLNAVCPGGLADLLGADPAGADTEDKKAHYLLLIKANQPELFRQLRSLPWTQATARRYDRETGHGRKETRTTRALTVTELGLDFPHAVQAAKILRHRTDLRSGKVTRQTVYALTDLTARQASPQRLGQLARSQWVIENRLHFVRDTTFTEDASKICTGHGPDNMATLRSFAINQLQGAGHPNIAAGLREMSYQPFHRPLDLLGLA
ncbi:ISAs1 family transposase [Streptomyces europaeiscabiei]|uniref:ISAs1 family transposase n=2 Tax=Streptomyces europaeiscabiei TaxID=146819 RepID=A0ABU4NRE4_9ACTN|nr:ISAs1 family transposase [Streptomyces europaeiscabiei]MDX3556666.1 ISAs1 family transposase [Streptomyces europaeiscabiei]MDX3704374.1 ISAs1 family transposase [Streptomyces europaeiscabiei]